MSSRCFIVSASALLFWEHYFNHCNVAVSYYLLGFFGGDAGSVDGQSVAFVRFAADGGDFEQGRGVGAKLFPYLSVDFAFVCIEVFRGEACDAGGAHLPMACAGTSLVVDGGDWGLVGQDVAGFQKAVAAVVAGILIVRAIDFQAGEKGIQGKMGGHEVQLQAAVGDFARLSR